MNPATAGADLDAMIDLTQEMIRNRHSINQAREELLEHEARADSARRRIDQFTRRQLELAARQAGFR